VRGAIEAEVIPPEAGPEGPKLRMHGMRGLGLFGTLLALLTMLAALGFGFLAFFGKILVAALLVRLVWPLVFGPEFTRWVFGSAPLPFWKLLLLFVTVGAVVALLRRPLWPKR